MTLVKKNTPAPTFEDTGDTGSEDQTSDLSGAKAEATAAAAAAAAPAASPQRAVAAAASTAVSTAVTGDMRIIEKLKDALKVDFNTLAQIQGLQGSFYDKETEADLGKSITLELLSFQDSFVCSPNDDKAEKELVKYSDDGKTAKDGTDLFAHLEELKAMNYPKAKITRRCVIVGALLSTTGATDLVDQLVQLDLPPSAKTQFDRFTANCAWKIRSGKLADVDAARMQLTATVATGPDKTKYTLIQFANAAPAA